jgi:membrane-bound serine protease (ClpP class)
VAARPTPWIVNGWLRTLHCYGLLPASFRPVRELVTLRSVLEATVTRHGILAVGGIVAMIAGSLMLVEGPIPQLRIRFSTTLAVAIPVALITGVLVRLVYLSHHRKSITGEEGMIGEEGTAKADIYNNGKVLVHGEYWSASPERPIPGPVLVVALQEFRA